MKGKITLVLIVWSGMVFGVQNINVNESFPVRVVVSNNDINMISLKNDRIESLALPNSVEVEQNNKTGSAYLKFKGNNSVKGFLISETGAKYQLEFVPSNIPSETITLIKPWIETKIQSADTREYTQMLAQLLRAMYNQSELDGYERTMTEKKVKFKKLNLMLETTYFGAAIDGQVYEYENSTKEIQNLKEIDFYDAGIRSVAIVNKTLYSGDVTKIYIMRDKV